MYSPRAFFTIRLAIIPRKDVATGSVCVCMCVCVCVGGGGGGGVGVCVGGGVTSLPPSLQL